jgi:hypothetical protein
MLVAALISLACAFGQEGHAAVGMVAQAFLTPETQLLLEKLYPQYSGKLQSYASWADQIKSNPKQWGWSKSLHYVNPKDNPSTVCEYNDARDCPDRQCIVGAIANYTLQAQCKQPVATREVAIKFLDHFIGDIAQPLHTCGRSRGGNDVDVLFDGQTASLHYVWDTSILVKRVRNDFKNDFNKYTTFIINAIKSGAYQSVASSWLSKNNLFAVSKNGNSLAAIDWLIDSNNLNCNTVWKAYDQDKSQDFGGQYYLDNYSIMDVQIAKAGFRLANLLNIVTKC